MWLLWTLRSRREIGHVEREERFTEEWETSRGGRGKDSRGRQRDGEMWGLFRAQTVTQRSGNWHDQNSNQTASDSNTQTHTTCKWKRTQTHRKLFSSCGPERRSHPHPSRFFHCVDKCNIIVSFYRSSARRNPRETTNREKEWWRGAFFCLFYRHTQAVGVSGEVNLWHNQNSNQTVGDGMFVLDFNVW